MIYKYFYNSEEKRLTAGIRLLIQFVLFVALFIITVVISNQIEDYYLSNLTQELLLIPLGLLSIYLPIILIDRRNVNSIGVTLSKVWFYDLLVGLLAGGVLMFFVFLSLYYSGTIEVTEFYNNGVDENFTLKIIGRFLGYFSVGLVEEAFSRGYHIKNISEGLNFTKIGNKNAVISAWIISSIVFGILHGPNPNTSILGVTNLILIGFLYGYVYVLTGSLAYPIGIHTAWNFFQGNVFGFSVSGFKPEVSFMISSNVSDDLLSGGNFGPEAGLIMIPTIVIGFIISHLFVKYKQGKTSLYEKLSIYP